MVAKMNSNIPFLYPQPTPSLHNTWQGVDLSGRSESLRLATEVKKLEREKNNLQTEVDRLQGELSQFNDDFFDEIEDLKYNYAEAVKRNVTYEEQLRAISRQFGVSFDIPSADDWCTYFAA